MTDKRAGQGKRLDLSAGMAVCKASGIDGMVAECPELLVKYPRGFLVYDERLRKPTKEFRKKEVYVLFGPPGTGKSYYALDHFPGHYRVPSPQGGSWWFDKYQGEEEVLFDEYGSEPARLLPYGTLLEYLDGFLLQVPYKGGHYWFKPAVVVLTSNYHPRLWYPTQIYEALERRITHLIEYVGFRQRRVIKCPQGWTSKADGVQAAASGTSASPAPEHQEAAQEGQAQAASGVLASEGHISPSSLHFLAPEEVEKMLLSDEALVNPL